MIQADKIDAILFDLDGTLVDTDDAAVDRLVTRLRPARRLFPNRNPRPFARWLLMQAETPGNALLTLLDAAGLDESLTAFNDRLRGWRGLTAPAHFHPIDGVGSALARLSSRYRLALVTSRSRRHIAAFRMAHPEVADHLSCFVGRQDTHRIKPHPAPLRLAAERLAIPIERCLMVGDTTVDVTAARRAGAWSAAVLCGFGERDELVRAGAHVVLDRTSDLTRILDGR